MIRNYLFILFLVLCSGKSVTLAQTEKVWVFGNAAGVDFNSGRAVPITTAMEGFGEANASVCDNKGQLLFYTDGSYVWNRNHQLMPDGKDLTPIRGNFTQSPTSSTSQGALIIPVPGNTSRYYIFSLTSVEQQQNAGRLYYSIVDMDSSGGLGNVLTDRKGVLLDSNLLEKMTGVRGDRCNIWLIVCDRSPTFKSYEITASGINLQPVVSNTGIGDFENYMPGCIALSPDRKKLAATRNMLSSGAGTNGLIVCDFNPVDGTISNAFSLLPGSGAYGICFSPNNTKLYVNATNGTSNPLYQFDLTKDRPADIQASQTYLGPSGFTQIKLAPDGKIYFRSSYDGSRLGSINYPDLSGTAAEFSSGTVILANGTRVGAGLPNAVPVFESDTLLTRMADTLPCFSQGMLLKARNAEGHQYLWNNNSTQNELWVSRSGTYWVQYAIAPCNWYTDTFNIYFPSGRLPQLGKSEACKNANNAHAWLRPEPGDSTTYTYEWRDARLNILSKADSLLFVAPGNYSVWVRSATGCDTLLSFELNEIRSEVSFLSDSLACTGDILTFQNASGSYFSSFQWHFGDGRLSEQLQPSHSYPEAGTYTVQLVGYGQLCNDTAMAKITVDKPVAASISVDRDQVCAGESIFFTTGVDDAITNWVWDFGDGEVTASMSAQQQHAYAQSGTMIVSLNIHQRSCQDTDVVDTIRVNPLPLVQLGENGSLCLNQTTPILFNIFPRQAGDRYLWSTGSQNDTLLVKHPGNYTLRISSADGCTNEEQVTITGPCTLDIPNAFSPNGDGINDYFFPRRLPAAAVRAFHMLLTDRWGNPVFETRQLDGRGWDGKRSDQQLPAGVYIYAIQLTTITGKVENYQGNVTLVR